MSDSLVPGLVVAQRFRLDRLLGEGGMGAVWAATHVVTHKRVALKVLKGAETDAAVRRFLREARAASAVRHTHIVQVHDVLMPEDGFPMMVMDLCVGESLSARLLRQRHIPLPQLAELLVPILSALGTAHSAGIVHRDLKPDNLFLDTAEDGRIVPKVLDFGIAKLNAAQGQAAATAALTETGAFMGTPYYMSPEQVFGEKDIDHRSDVWAVGVILYECLCGARPFEGGNFGQIMKGITSGAYRPMHEHVADLPEQIISLVARMLQVKRDERPSDLREPYEVLRLFANTQAASFKSASRVIVDVESPPDGSADTFDPASNSVRELGQAATKLAGPERGRRWLPPTIAGGGAVTLLLTGLWWAGRLPSDPGGGSAGQSSGAQLIVSTQPTTAPSLIDALQSASPQLLPSSGAGLAPSASAHAIKPGKPLQPMPQPIVVKSVTPTPDKPVPSAPPQSSALPGGVVPFVP